MAMEQNPALDRRDLNAVVNSVANNRDAAKYVWEYLDLNWKTMYVRGSRSNATQIKQASRETKYNRMAICPM